VLEEPLDCAGSNLKIIVQNIRKILPIEGRPDIEIRIDKPDILELRDQVGDFLGPILAAGLDHTGRKTMQRNIKNMPPFSFKPRGQSAPLVMMLQQQHRMPQLRQIVGTSQSTQTTANHDDVILILYSF